MLSIPIEVVPVFRGDSDLWKPLTYSSFGYRLCWTNDVLACTDTPYNLSWCILFETGRNLKTVANVPVYAHRHLLFVSGIIGQTSCFKCLSSLSAFSMEHAIRIQVYVVCTHTASVPSTVVFYSSLLWAVLLVLSRFSVDERANLLFCAFRLL